MGRGRLWVVGVVLAVLLGVALLLHVLPLSAGLVGGGVNPSAASPLSTSAPTVSSYPRLRSLSGSLVCLSGREITAQLWSRMRDYNASNSVVAVYVGWLRSALAVKPVYALTADPKPKIEYGYGVGYVADHFGHKYWWVDAYGWRAEPPSMDGIVRVGVVKLGFGAALIVTAYQVRDHVDIVVHGTVINATEYKWTALQRALAMDKVSPRFYHILPNISVVLYRIRLTGHGSYLETSDGDRIRVGNIYVLVEIPIAITKELAFLLELPSPEYMGWMMIGRPALGLAIRLAYPPNTDPLQLYREIVFRITEDLVSRGTYYMWSTPDIENLGYLEDYETPLTLRNINGCCGDYAIATAHFASLALGAMTAVFADTGHSMSLVLLPSTVFGHVKTSSPDIEGMPGSGPISIHHDIDGDNVIDAAIVLGNTDPQDYTLKIMDEVLRNTIITTDYNVLYTFVVLTGDMLSPVLKGPVDLTYSGYIYALGFTEYVRSLPDWLTPPWYPKLENVYEKIIRLLSPEDLKYVAPLFGFSVGGAKDAVAKIPMEEVETPSYKLALRNIVGDILVIDSGVRTPPIVFWEMLGNQTTTGTGQGPGSGSSGSTGSAGSSGGSGTGNSSSSSGGGGSARVINAIIHLSLVYVDAPTPWGQMPVFRDYVGTSMAGQTNVTVIAYPAGTGEYCVNVFFNGTHVHGEVTGLPATISFSYGGAEYRLVLETPAPPVINKTVELELVPVNNVPVPLSNGTVLNVTMYKVNETFRIGNTTIVVYGYVSRLGIDLDIYVFHVPPSTYTVAVTGLDAEKTVEYSGALQVYIHYKPPEYQLVPAGTHVKITVQPLNLTITILVKG